MLPSDAVINVFTFLLKLNNIFKILKNICFASKYIKKSLQ